MIVLQWWYLSVGLALMAAFFAARAGRCLSDFDFVPGTCYAALALGLSIGALASLLTGWLA